MGVKRKREVGLGVKDGFQRFPAITLEEVRALPSQVVVRSSALAWHELPAAARRAPSL